MNAVANSPPRAKLAGSNNHHYTRPYTKTSPAKTSARTIEREDRVHCNEKSKPAASLKRSRVHAHSSQTHRLNNLQIILHADDSPASHFVGIFRIVKGVEDDQVATPRRRLSAATAFRREKEEEEASDYSLSELFAGTREDEEEEIQGLSPQPNNWMGSDTHQRNNSSSLAVHGNGMIKLNDRDRAEPVFQDSVMSIHAPILGLLQQHKDESTVSSSSSSRDEELSVAAKSEDASSSQHHPSNPEESNSIFGIGHESEISIDPLNNFVPRRSNRAKAAIRRAAAESLLAKDTLSKPCHDASSSFRHKSVETINHESKSHQSRYDESLLARKTRRDRAKQITRSKVKDRRLSRSPPRETPKSHRRHDHPCSDKLVKDQHTPENTSMNAHEISGDSSCTLGNKSNSQEFAQLDLGDQQGIRMVNRAEILTEEHGGLHEHKAVVDVSPPPTGSRIGGFSGILRSKVASFRSNSTRILGAAEPSNTAANNNNALTYSPPSNGNSLPRGNRPGLAVFRAHSSRTLAKFGCSDPPIQRPNSTSPKGGTMMGLALRTHFSSYRPTRVESKETIPEDKSIALENKEVKTSIPARAPLFSNNLLTRLNESFSNNLNLAATLLDDDESSFGFPP